MTGSRVHLSADVAAVIRALPPEPKRRVRAALDEIRRSPVSGKVLVRELEGFLGFRAGRLRIVYRHQEDGNIYVIAAGWRETVYLEAARLAARRPLP